MEHYPNIWGIIQNYYLPKSLIPVTDYIAVRHAISLDYYFYGIVSNGMLNSSWCDINDDEKSMLKRTAGISSLRINSINYRVTLITHRGELRASKQTRSTFFDESDENTPDFLDCFLFNSDDDEDPEFEYEYARIRHDQSTLYSIRPDYC